MLSLLTTPATATPVYAPTSVQNKAAKPSVFNAWGGFHPNEGETPLEVINRIGANFSVRKDPLVRIPRMQWESIRKGGNTLSIDLSPKDIITDYAAVVRNDTDSNLSVVGANYGIVNYDKAFDFLNYLEEVTGTAPKIECAGLLGKNGERMFITCTLGNDIYISQNDAIKNYAVFATSHDGTLGVTMFMTPVRVICQNTLALALRKCNNKLTFKHTKFVMGRLDFEKEENRKHCEEVFAKYGLFTKEFLTAMKQLKDVNVTADEVKDFAAKLYLSPAGYTLYKQNNRDYESVTEISTRAKNQITGVLGAIESGVGQSEYRGTKLWLLNGLTTYIQNEKKWKNDNAKFASTLNGAEADRVQTAYNLLATA